MWSDQDNMQMSIWKGLQKPQKISQNSEQSLFSPNGR
jgi:hypothetical protein